MWTVWVNYVSKRISEVQPFVNCKNIHYYLKVLRQVLTDGQVIKKSGNVVS